MNILAIESSGNVASVAVVNEKEVLAEFTTNHKKTHSVTLMPLVSYMMDMAEMSMEEIDHIAVSSGPGSFTGLRIGGATVKALAHGSGKTIIPVPTLDALAYNIFMENSVIVPIMDARRSEVYTCAYICENGELNALMPHTAESFDNLIERIKKLNKPAVFLGDGCFVHGEKIIAHGFEIAQSNNLVQRAASVGALAIKYAGEGKAVGYDKLELTYLRKPQAEREYDERNRTDDRGSTV